jgi:hypothetical protein
MPQGRSKKKRKYSSLQGCGPRTFQVATSRYIYYAIPTRQVEVWRILSPEAISVWMNRDMPRLLFPCKKSQVGVLFYSWMCGPLGQSGWVRKISPIVARIPDRAARNEWLYHLSCAG